MSAKIVNFSEAAQQVRTCGHSQQLTMIEEFLREMRKLPHVNVQTLDDMYINTAIDMPGFPEWYKKRFGHLPPAGRFLRKNPPFD